MPPPAYPQRGQSRSHWWAPRAAPFPRRRSKFRRRVRTQERPQKTEIANRLLPELGAPDAKVRIHVLENPFLNAFALSNGSIYINTGLLAGTENEAELAVLVGHELAHYLKRHSLEENRIARNKHSRAVAGSVALAIFGGVVVTPNRLGAYMQEVATSGHSRENEKEADLDAFAAIQRAGYSAAAAPRVFEHMQLEAIEVEQPDEHHGSHPRLTTRLGYAEEWANQFAANPPSQISAEEQGRLAAEKHDFRIAAALLRTAELSFGIGYRRKAIRSVDRYLATKPNDIEGHLFSAQLASGRLAKSQERSRVANAYAEVLRLDPQHGTANRNLGLIRHFEGDGASARRMLRAYLTAEPEAADRKVIEGLLRNPVPRAVTSEASP
ncbi:MAG: M48 family metalloprotease [Myxococcota bacterium]